jgi:hypothetical protein
MGGVETLTLKGTSGGTFTVPLAWTDRKPPSVWQILGKNPPRLAAPALWTLVELVNSLSDRTPEESEP